MVAFDCALGEQYAVPANRLEEGFVAVHASELEQLGLGHMALGGMLTRAWNLPPNLVAAIEHYADPSSAPVEFRTTVACVTLGAHCGDIGTATNPGRALSEFRSAATVLGFSEAAAQAIIEEGLDQAAVLLQIFEGPGVETIVPAEILSRAHEALLELSLALAQETDRMANEEAELRTQAQVDVLTSVANRRHFDEVIAQQVAISLRYSRPLSLLIIDVDHFKLVNDTYGHPGGDVVLRDLAARIRSSVRAADFVARYGGEEFAVLLSETGGEGACDAAERIRLAISATPIGIAPAKFVPVTVSVGLATLGEAGAHSVASLISSADTALYAAKHGGRNQVVMAAA